MMKSLRSLSLIASIGLALAAGSAWAHGNNGNGNNGNQGGVSASGQITAGAISGSANSFSEGSSVAASQINGFGQSIQNAWGNSGGQASIGGTVNYQGAQVITNTSHYANSFGSGSVSGNAPITVGDSIANGNAAFGQTKVNAGGTATWGTVAIGAVGAIKTTGNIGGFGPH